MARRPCTFRQQDATRAARAAIAAGLDVQRIEIDRDGRIVVVTGKSEAAVEPANDLDKWMSEPCALG